MDLVQYGERVPPTFSLRKTTTRFFLRGRFIPLNIWVVVLHKQSRLLHCTRLFVYRNHLSTFSDRSERIVGRYSAHGLSCQVLPARGASFWAGACKHQAFVQTFPLQTAKLQVQWGMLLSQRKMDFLMLIRDTLLSLHTAFCFVSSLAKS